MINLAVSLISYDLRIWEGDYDNDKWKSYGAALFSLCLSTANATNKPLIQIRLLTAEYFVIDTKRFQWVCFVKWLEKANRKNGTMDTAQIQTETSYDNLVRNICHSFQLFLHGQPYTSPRQPGLLAPISYSPVKPCASVAQTTSARMAADHFAMCKSRWAIGSLYKQTIWAIHTRIQSTFPIWVVLQWCVLHVHLSTDIELEVIGVLLLSYKVTHTSQTIFFIILSRSYFYRQ